MKKYYTFGEMIFALREEYKECKYLLDELNKLVNIEGDIKDSDFLMVIKEPDRENGIIDKGLKLCVEKRYLEVFKKIQYLKYNYQYLYRAIFNVEKEENGLYGLKYKDIFSHNNGKKYIPEVHITNPEKFSELVDELYSSYLAQLKTGYFKNNHDSIMMDFHLSYIDSTLGDRSIIIWNGYTDNLKYLITRHNSPHLIEEILNLEMPADKISPDWLELLERHDDLLSKELLFDVDINTHSKKGILQVSEIEKKTDKSIVRLLKKTK